MTQLKNPKGVQAEEETLYDRASGLRSLLLLVVSLISIGMSYQALKSADAAQDKQIGVQSNKIDQLITITQDLSTKQALAQQATNANTKAMEANTKAIERVIGHNDASLHKILTILSEKN